MGWLNTQMRLDDRRAIVQILRPDGAPDEDMVNTINSLSNDPVVLESFLAAAIAEARPSLKNCCIWWLDFDAMRYCWEVGIIHPSLPRVSLGTEATRLGLHPESDPHPATA